MKFSVIITVYHADSVTYLKESFSSIINQTMMPNEIVLVIDGLVSDALSSYIRQIEKKYRKLLKVVKLKDNLGLSMASNEGIKHCSYEIIARMDADDYSVESRFEKQLTFLIENPEVSMVGGSYAQYDSELRNKLSIRKLPYSGYKLYKYSRLRTPINHVTVMYRKQSALDVGGYPDIRWPFEDWWLANRLLKNGYKIVNLKHVLVNVRGGQDFIQRRHGLKYAKNEIQNLYAMYLGGLLSLFNLLSNILIRITVRLVPLQMTTRIYSILRTKG